VDVRILGPLEVVGSDGRRVDLGALRQRAVLAVLVVHLGEVVSVDRLIDELWGGTPPNAAISSLQAYVSNLRRALEPDRPTRTPATLLVTEAPGYALRVDGQRVDAGRFESLATAGRQTLEGGDARGALAIFDDALALWRGDVLAEFAYEPFAAPLVARLDEARAATEEARVEALLRLDDLTGALASLGRLVTIHPLRERLRAMQITALYRAGRQAEALRAFEDARVLLAEELGVEPGPELRRLNEQVLHHDVSLAPSFGFVADAAIAPTPTTSPSRRHASFVGREAALEVLEKAARDSVTGRTRIVLVNGEAGIGKTTLVEELADRLATSGAVVCWGRCHDDEGAPPMWPWVQILRSLGVQDAPLPGPLTQALAPLLPEIGAQAETDLVPAVARFRLFDATREALQLQARKHPLVLVLDDVHWADASSLRLLQFLATELRNSPVLIVATFRDPESPANPALIDLRADVARHQDVEWVHLTGLHAGDVRRLLQDTGEVAEPDLEPLALRLHERTSGNPFFITELVRLMRSEHKLSADHADPDIPAAVADVLRRRIERLPDDTQTVLGVASVAGRSFDIDLLARACGLDADRTLEALEAALVSRIVVERSPTAYEFGHALVSETMYADLAPARRLQLHARVAAAIEATWPDDLEPHYDELAHHYSRSPSSYATQAVRFARLAAEQATARLAFDEAAAHLRTAVAALQRLDAIAAVDRVRILMELAAAERRAGNMATATDVHDQALTLARRHGDPTLVSEVAIAYGEIGLWQVRQYGVVDENIVAALSDALGRVDDDDTALRARMLSALAVALYYREGDRERCPSLAREAVELARLSGDQSLLAAVLVELMVMLDAVPDDGEQDAAAAELETLIELDLPRETATAVLGRLCRFKLATADGAGFQRHLREFSRRFGSVHHPGDRLWVLWAEASAAFLQDRFADAERLAGEAFHLHQQLGIWGAHETYALHMVLIWREQGRLQEVAPIVEPLLAESVHPSAAKLRGLFALDRDAPSEIGGLLATDPVPRSRDFTWLADVCVTAELAAAAGLPCREELYEMLLPFADRIVTMDATFICLGAASYYLGLLAASLARPDAARHFDHALALDERAGALPWARRTRADLDRLVPCAR
jgi:DNA-binding SARP family transcriptional activator